MKLTLTLGLSVLAVLLFCVVEETSAHMDNTSLNGKVVHKYKKTLTDAERKANKQKRIQAKKKEKESSLLQ